MPEVGDTLDEKYRLLRHVGEGGMGVVFEANHLRLGRRVAIKVLHPFLARDATIVSRFWNEAHAASAILHPNIVDVFDVGVDAATGQAFIVEEFLRGPSLAQLLHSHPRRRLKLAEALDYLLPIAGALTACHRRGIVHRDIKPENILISRALSGAPVPKLIDFGISKMLEGGIRNTATGALLGTPAYMSPEQAAASTTIDARSDVWSLGVVFFEVLSGELPYVAPNGNLMLGKILYERPRLLVDCCDVHPAAAAVIQRALEPNLEVRWQSMQAFLGALLECPCPELAQRASVVSEVDEAAASAPLVEQPTPPPASSEPASRGPLSPHGAGAPPVVSVRPRRRLVGASLALLVAGMLIGVAWISDRTRAAGNDPVAPTPIVIDPPGAEPNLSAARAPATPPTVPPTAPHAVTTPPLAPTPPVAPPAPLAPPPSVVSRPSPMRPVPQTTSGIAQRVGSAGARPPSAPRAAGDGASGAGAHLVQRSASPPTAPRAASGTTPEDPFRPATGVYQ
ncbi:MAG: protein kinase [Polyangiales bacterium]